MAYRPPIVQPRTSKAKSARAALAAKERRAALVTALRDRLAVLMANVPKEQPILPPRPPLSPTPNIPPRVPISTAPQMPPLDPRTAGWVPPSAFDWIRQPGFYDEPDSGVPGRF